ncbi:aldose epimerase family protein [Pseudobacteroides cellulosolvens]|uniref:Aldose 1-epimerase n=1 Tax=Pseudobacteroides cellulosolvens ATCC 35603 = DSM 2933 TaxID=398512 RepID=A0A0L6JIP0_9FIRM|nr:aldose epimerase family protein [Pseudobacteroides cellulosolvens]KNY25605.1 Aldose 1-epimerase [Pseudobacteroides cellulosolvens ATCC 35603 = DSM 2933]
MSIIREKFVDGYDRNDIDIFTLSNSNGIKVKITNFGGIIISIFVPDKNGNYEDVVLGYDKLEDYLEDDLYFGALVGRHANRIEDSCFEINGVEYQLEKNDGENHIHGGIKGFNKVIWNAYIVKEGNQECLKLTYLSKDGEENYPGNLKVTVIYSLTDDNALKIDYHAVSDKDTVINLTNHAYFNLSGHGAGDISKHHVKIYADKFTPINEECLTTGEIRDVYDTPMNFTTMKPIGTEINVDDPQIINGEGYDHNFILNEPGAKLKMAAEVYDPASGRFMEVYTTKPGIQLYTGNHIEGSYEGKGNVQYTRRSGFCLETQYFPNSLKHKNFPSPIFKAGEEYIHTTVYKFTKI